MNKTQIKKEAQQFFTEGNYSEAVKKIANLDGKDIILYGVDNKWFEKEQIINELVNNDELFTKIFDCKLSDQLLFQYFFKKYSEVFVSKLAQKYSKLLVNAVRTTQLFLQENRIDFLLKIYLPIEFQSHQKIWKLFQKEDSRLWREIEEKITNLSEIPLEEVLSQTILWLENKRFERDDNQNIHHLASVYSFFIKLYLQKYPVNKPLSEDDFFEYFHKSILKENKHIKELLNAIDEWVSFDEQLLSMYCFDLEVNPYEENGVIYVGEKPEHYYHWKLDGARYELNQLSYSTKATLVIQQLIEEKKLTIPKGKLEKDEEINYSLAIEQMQTKLLLENIAVENFVFKNKKVEIEALYAPLQDLTRKLQNKYEIFLQEFKSNNWFKTYELILKKEIDTVLNPYFYTNKESNVNFNNYETPVLSKDLSKHIIELFSYYVNPDYQFNRFNIAYDVWYNPFMKIGNMLFCPAMFLSNNNWFYAFAQAGIKNLAKKHPNKKLTAENHREENRTTKLYETKLGKALKEKGWEVKVIDDKTEEIEKGDVDIFVSDNNATILIQAKRTYFRLNPKDAYYEYINPDRKASLQLNDAEKFLQQPNDIFQIKTKKVVKWIVSTSYENTLYDFDGCKKINVFDLYNALENANIKTVNDLIDYIEKDKLIKVSLSNSVKDFIYRVSLNNIGLPVSLYDPQIYRKPIFISDEVSKSYYERYNKAMEFYHSNKKEKLIKLLKKCLNINPNDLDVYGSLGNAYADIKDYNNSFACFRKVLTIVPDEPYITRNYITALIETDKFDNVIEALYLAIKLYGKYYFLDNIFLYPQFINKYIDYIIKQRKLSNEKLLEIISEWHKIK